MTPKLIWANLAVDDLQRTTQFYTALGFQESEHNNSPELTSLQFGQHNFVINFFTKDRFREPHNGSIENPTSGSEVIFSLSAESKEEVDQWRDAVVKAGGTIYSEPQTYQQGYTCGFADPDGHKFNALYWPGM